MTIQCNQHETFESCNARRLEHIESLLEQIADVLERVTTGGVVQVEDVWRKS